MTSVPWFNIHSFYGGTLASRESTFFTATQRSVAVSQILRTTSFGKRAKGEVGIEPLLEDSIFTAAYPLHDVSIMLFFASLFILTESMCVKER